MSSRNPEPTAERFWSKVDKTDGCWNWTGGTTVYGYGRMRVSGVKTPAHRVALLLAGIEIPEGFHPDHECKNPGCVRVGDGHLRVIPAVENLATNHGCQLPGHARNAAGKCADCQRETKRRWRAANPEQIRGYHAASRARRKAVSA